MKKEKSSKKNNAPVCIIKTDTKELIFTDSKTFIKVLHTLEKYLKLEYYRE